MSSIFISMSILLIFVGIIIAQKIRQEIRADREFRKMFNNSSYYKDIIE